MNIYAPGGLKNAQQNRRLENINNGRYRIMEFLFDNISGSSVDLIPQYDNNIYVHIFGVNYVLNTTTTLNLASTGIGGLVDGITFTPANARNFLVWAIADNANSGLQGFAITHKPYSASTAISGGSANKGATGKTFTVTNAFQFSVGARICIRNTAGTAPQYQWNWATITSIPNNTSIVVTMDNKTYGSNITSTSGSEILQWNTFRPYVMGGTQELYSKYYTLIGELYTDTSGNMIRAYRADEPIRELEWDLAYQSNSTVSGASLYLGRWIPLWSSYFNCYLIGQGAVNNRIFLANSRATATVVCRIFNASIDTENNSGFIPLDQDARVLVTNNCSTNGYIRLLQYYIPTGMRG